MTIRTDFESKEKLLASDLNDAFGSIKNETIGEELFQYNEAPTYAGVTGQFRTAFAYKPVSLQIYIGKLRQVRNLDYQESEDPSASQPTKFIFLTSPGVSATDPDDTGNEIRVDYLRSDI